MSEKKTKLMKRESNEALLFDSKAVKNEIAKNGIYRADGVELKLWDSPEEEGDDDIKVKQYFLGKVESNKTFFSGSLNSKFQRDGFGYNKYSNGDQYLGSFSADSRNKNGIYIWNPTIKNGRVQTDLYHGAWEDDQKHYHGLYLWINEPEGNEELEQANFDAYIGDIETEEYDKGTYLVKNNDDYFFYYGSFTKEGKKNDDNGFFYSASQDRLFKGKIKQDIFKEGYVAYFDEDGLLQDFVYVEFDNKEEVKKIVLEKDIKTVNLEKLKEEMTKFRVALLDKDYFDNIYFDYRKCVDFLSNVSGYNIFEDKNQYESLVKLCGDYNTDDITNDISYMLNQDVEI